MRDAKTYKILKIYYIIPIQVNVTQPKNLAHSLMFYDGQWFGRKTLRPLRIDIHKKMSIL